MVYCGLLNEAKAEELDDSENGVEEDECELRKETEKRRQKKGEGLLKRILRRRSSALKQKGKAS